MNGNNLLTSGERAEKEFKDFIGRLLEAHSYDFMKEKILFSRKTLERTLTSFCHIIADELRCDSCTVQIQMYDSKLMSKELLNERLTDHLLKTARTHIDSNTKNEGEKKKLKKIIEKSVELMLNREDSKKMDDLPAYLEKFIKYRIDLLKDSLTFPYWVDDYRKGASSLIAINPDSPWITVFRDEKDKLKYISLTSGISKDIYQENVARVRDRLSIRVTRGFRKLGQADMIVWNNVGWKYVFKDYYGVPIRIHSGGEVIGILKAENKKSDWRGDEEKAVEKSLKVKSGQDLRNKIIKKIKKKYEIIEDIINVDLLDKLNVSFFSLVYLEKDFKSKECIEFLEKGQSVDKLLYIPFPDPLIRIFKKIDEDLLNDKTGTFDPTNSLGRLSPSENSKDFFRKRKVLGGILKYLKSVYCSEEGENEWDIDSLENYSLEKYRSDCSEFNKRAGKILTDFKDKIKNILDNDKINSLKPKGNERPPMQLFTRSIEDEKELWYSWLKGESPKGLSGLYKYMKKLYGIFENEIHKKIKYVKIEKEDGKCESQINNINKSKILGKIKNIIHECNGKEFSIESWLDDNKLPVFHFKVSFKFKRNKANDSKKKQTIDFFIVIPPTREEIQDGSVPNPVEYGEVNKIWCSTNDNTLGQFCMHRQKFNGKINGEFVVFDTSEKITDLLLDRLAARIQAFANAYPVTPFSPEDTYKLKWAAYEIGKLVEREISYRANRHHDPIPLTAMEFYRIPISDLSFVDDLRSRRNRLGKIADNIDVYLKNMIFQMEMTDEVEYSSRIKGYRSMFQRLGERFEGYVRGNIAIWVFLLSFALENDNGSCTKNFKVNKKLMDKGEKKGEAKKNSGLVFCEDLKKFRESIEESLDKPIFSIPDSFCRVDQLGEIYGDLKFDSPSFMDEKYLKDLHDTKKFLEGLKNGELGKEKIEKAKMQVEKIIRYHTKDTMDTTTSLRENVVKKLILHLEKLEQTSDKKSKKAIFTEANQTLKLAETEITELLGVEISNHSGKLKNAFMRIRGNLENEGFQIIDTVDISTSSEVDNFFNKKQKLLNDLLIRNYSYFVRDSLSLLIQIANLSKSLGEGDDGANYLCFKDFYKKCRELRKFLCSPPQELEGKKKYHLEKIFGLEKNSDNDKGAWKGIKEFINKYNTGTVFPDNKADNYLPLTPQSIYKRIRTLNNILHRQIPSAMLDWELGRFDLYGTRMNCLYKNQVFVLYEKIWNKGDPFFIYDPQAKDYNAYYQGEINLDTNRYRQRWLCLRTSFLQDEYNACQIASLIDPKTVEAGYWEYISTYNLKCVQYVLGKMFIEFEPGAALQYRNYSWHRHLLSECYSNWYKYSANLFQKEYQEQDREQKETKWYGSFLFESVINLLMLMISSKIDYKNREGSKNRYGFREKTLEIIVGEMNKPGEEDNLFFKIIIDLYWVIRSGIKYSNEIKEGFMKREPFSRIPFKCSCRDPKKTSAQEDLAGNGNNEKKKPVKWLFICEKNVASDEKNIANKCDLYETSLELLTKIIKGIKDETDSTEKKEEGIGTEENTHETSSDTSRTSRDQEIFIKVKTNLEKERTFFAELDVADEIIKGFQMPMFFFDVNQKDAFGQKIFSHLKSIMDKLGRILKRAKEKGKVKIKINPNYWGFIYRTLKRIRREQKSYLFDPGDKNQNYPGLGMRDKSEVLGRIKNYVLLFSKKDIDKSNKHLFPGWNAHDLYYYIHSLIPMEIQIRTELSSTFADQYHDDIYKGKPPPGTELPHSMIKNAGESLDKIDRELEIDYEDYIVKCHHREEEEVEEGEDL